MIDEKKTHRERKDPQVSISRLADYMAASEQVRRSMMNSFRFQPIGRVIQHKEARRIISNYLSSASRNLRDLEIALDDLESKICDSQFEIDTLQHNCDYLRRFIAMAASIDLPDAEYIIIDSLPSITLNGTKVTFSPQALASRVTRRNTLKSGALMLRYAKNEPLPTEVGLWQSSFMFGYLTKYPLDETSQPEKALCLTLDCYLGVAYQAPGDAIYRFKEMAAASGGIAERWAALKPPAGSVL